MKLLRKGSLLAVALLCGMTTTQALEFELAPFYGYRIGGELEDVDVNADDSAAYGVSFGISINDNSQIEFLYSHQGTEVDLDDFQVTGQEIQLDVDLDHWLLGWLVQGSDDQIKPFFSFHAGILDINPDGADGEDYFTWSLGGGAKIYVSDVIGFRLAARFDFTYVDSDSAVYCNWYGYCFTGTDADYFNQTEFTAGLIFKFGK